VDGNVVDFEQQRSAAGEPLLNQILHNLLLAINGDALVYQRLEIDTMQIAVDANVYAPMQHPFALQAIAYSHIAEEIGGPVFDQAGSNTIFDVVAAAIFDND
jgi:hypothetical protein